MEQVGDRPVAGRDRQRDHQAGQSVPDQLDQHPPPLGIDFVQRRLDHRLAL